MTHNEPRLVNVLLVDDSAFARSVGKRVLRSAGVGTIHVAANGEEAIEHLSQGSQSIDVLFCDLMMPGMDGVEIVRHIETLSSRPAVVFVSAANAALLNAAEDTAKARGLTVLGSIQKPLTPDQVRRVLAHLDDRPLPNMEPTPGDITPESVKAGLANHEFLLHYQPKVSMADGSVTGFEALVRWQHPVKGMMPPGDFIGFAEKNGLIGPLTDRVVMLGLRQVAAWATDGLRATISINLSAETLIDLDLPDRLAWQVAHYGIEPQQIMLEITESGLFHDVANALDILARLHMKGFPLSIDDFGTGYSSMEQLRRVPFAEMKIDRSFVKGAMDDEKIRSILEFSATLGRSLQMSVVAEGVETQDDWDAARAAGVNVAQGYFIARPMPAADIPAWRMAWNQEHLTSS
jgi:EAL domain-containing protein (putative c-di-GMP-specific phosphodiesterase class I)